MKHIENFQTFEGLRDLFSAKKVIGIIGPNFRFGDPNWIDHIGEENYLDKTDKTILELFDELDKAIIENNSKIKLQTFSKHGPGMYDFFGKTKVTSFRLYTEPFVGSINYNNGSYMPSWITIGHDNRFTTKSSNFGYDKRYSLNDPLENTMYAIPNKSAKSLVYKFAKKYNINTYEIEN